MDEPWNGRVFMNPPYGHVITKWAHRFVTEPIHAGIALVPARSDTRWWRKLRDLPVCLVHGRLRFVGNDSRAPFPSALFYRGPDRRRFRQVFSEIGDNWVSDH